MSGVETREEEGQALFFRLTIQIAETLSNLRARAIYLRSIYKCSDCVELFPGCYVFFIALTGGSGPRKHST